MRYAGLAAVLLLAACSNDDQSGPTGDAQEPPKKTIVESLNESINQVGTDVEGALQDGMAERRRQLEAQEPK